MGSGAREGEGEFESSMVHLVGFQKQRYHGRAARLLLDRRRQGAGSGRAGFAFCVRVSESYDRRAQAAVCWRQSLAVNDSMSQRRVGANAAQGDSVE
jgi:hypothetical protein